MEYSEYLHPIHPMRDPDGIIKKVFGDMVLHPVGKKERREDEYPLKLQAHEIESNTLR